MPLALTPDRPRHTNVWRQALRSSVRLDLSQIEPLAALRCTVGVAVPLLGAVALADPAVGMFAAVGAVAAGFGSFQGHYRSRARVMLLAVGGMAVSLFLGSLVGRSTVAAVGSAAVWGFGAGLLVALGPAAGFVALQSAVAAFVAGAFPATVSEALLRALLVIGGGLIQVALVVVFWPLKRFRAERKTLARIFRSLAEYAADPDRHAGLPPEPHTLAGFAPIRRDPQPFARSRELLLFHALFDEADHIRTALAAYLFTKGGTSADVVPVLAGVMGEIADALEEGRAPDSENASWCALQRAELRATGDEDGVARALLGHVRSAYRLAGMPALDETDGGGAAAPLQSDDSVRQAWLTLSANLSLRSAAFRHALRLALTLAVATAASHAGGIERGHWIAMTALLVLRPEFVDTFVRGTTRIVGTLAGAALAALLVEWLTTHPAFVTTLLLAFVWAGFTLFRASYTLFTICFTGYVVLLLYLGHVPGPEAAWYRAVNTLAGGALALLVYRLWPTWEAPKLREHLAAECDALADDTDAMLRMYVDPARIDRAALAQSRAHARLTRSNAETSVDRMLSEPESGHLNPDAVLSLLAAFRRYALASLALHARLEAGSVPADVSGLVPFRQQLTSRLRGLADALRRGTVPPSGEALQATRTSLDRAFSEQLDMLVESVDSMAAAVEALGTARPARTAGGESRHRARDARRSAEA